MIKVIASAFCGAAALFGAAASYAETVEQSTRFPDLTDGHICVWDGSVPHLRGASDYTEADTHALMVTDWIMEVVGLQPNFQVLSAEFARGGGAFATIHRGKRYIVFDRAYTNWGEGQTDWHAIGVAAHEVGHHLASHVFTNEISKHAEELEADEFAGFVMGYLGARLDQALTLFPGNGPASATHPAHADRRVAIAAGWHRGSSRRSGSATSCETQWRSDKVYVEGVACRVAQVCASGRPRTRFSCQNESGDWVWRN